MLYPERTGLENLEVCRNPLGSYWPTYSKPWISEYKKFVLSISSFSGTAVY